MHDCFTRDAGEVGIGIEKKEKMQESMQQEGMLHEYYWQQDYSEATVNESHLPCQSLSIVIVKMRLREQS